MKNKVTKVTKGSNVPRNMGHRSFGRQFKILVAEAYLSTPEASYKALGEIHGISGTQVKHWSSQYTTGLLEESNAVAFSRRPRTTAGKKDALVNLRVKK